MMDKGQRNCGIDLLKIFSMLGVVWLHVNAIALYNQPDYSGYFAWMSLADRVVHSVAILSVNCFALTSGYLLCESRFKTERLVRVGLQVVFWVLVSSFLSLFFCKTFLPPDFGCYWYVNAYLGILILMPALNGLIRIWSKNIWGGVLVIGIVVLLGSQFGLSFRHGYSAWWLSVLYLIGGLIRTKSDAVSRVRCRNWVFGTLASCALISVSLLLIERCPGSFCPGHSLWNLVNTYDSPLVVAGAVFMFLCVVSMNPSARMPRAVMFLSKHSLAVYLIHLSGFGGVMLSHLHKIFLPLQNSFVISVCEIILAACIFLCCAMADGVRDLLFRVLGLNRLVTRASGILDEKIHFLVMSERGDRRG